MPNHALVSANQRRRLCAGLLAGVLGAVMGCGEPAVQVVTNPPRPKGNRSRLKALMASVGQLKDKPQPK